jgi:hypothetical protein
MKNLIKKISSILLAIAFLISSSGFFIYEHHCNTHNLSQVSFLLENFDCHHDNETDHLNCDNASACCMDSENNSLSAKEILSKENNCCKTENHFFKIKSAFEKPVIKNTILVTSKIIHLLKYIVSIDDDKEDSKPDAKPDLKIHLLSGKKLVFFLHQQKITPLIF